jgi:hypothetical protein
MDGPAGRSGHLDSRTLEARVAGVTLDLPGGWLTAESLSDPARAAALGGDARRALDILVAEFAGSDGVAIDFAPVLAAVSKSADRLGPVIPTRGIVVDVDEPMASTAASHTAAQIGGVYTRLWVDDTEWAAEILSPSRYGADDMRLAMYLVGYEDRTVLAVATATPDLFDTGVFRSIMRTIRTTRNTAAG